MKLTVLLLSLTIYSFGNSFSQSFKLDLNVKDKPIREVLKMIEDQSGFRFFYNDRLANLNNVATVEANRKPLKDVLTELLADQKLSYTILDNNMIVILPSEVSQANTLTGTVTDALTGEPLPGVNITVEGTTIGTVSDPSGKYTIDIPSANVVVVFSFVGYVTEKVQAAGRSTIDMTLVADIQKLDEVVVIGYGTRTKKDITTSVSTMSSEDITKNVSSSAEYSMMGRMAGVNVSGATGDPLSRPTVRIRGVNTWGVADPIYVIDGIPVTEIGAGAEAIADTKYGTLRGNVNIMTLIDPNDIESISVLKDAAAAAVYGVRAANGVILITTKQGKKGDKPMLEFNARYGIQNVGRTYDVMSTDQLIKFKEDAYLANTAIGNNKALWKELNPAASNYAGNSDQNIDWQKAGLNKNAPSQEYNLRLSGGTDKSTYAMSAGYANSEGLLLGKSMNRYSFSTNISSQLNKWIKVGANYRLAYIKGRDNNIWAFDLLHLAQMPTWQPIYDPDGYLGYASSANVNANGVTGSIGKWSSTPYDNRLGALATTDNTYNELRNMGTAYIEIEPLKGLKIKGSLSGDYYNRKNEIFTDYDGWVFSSNMTQSNSQVYANSVGDLSNIMSENFNLVKELSVNYVKSLGDHNIDLLFNASDQKYGYNWASGDAMAMTSKAEGLRFVSGMTPGTAVYGSDKMQNALQGYLGRLSYNYKSKYYLDVTVRRDGTSKFKEDKQWGTFPGASIAWRISEEPFLKNISWINDIKIRVARGSLGNQEVRDLAWGYVVSPASSYSWGASTNGFGNYGRGATIADMANPSISWETTTTTNFGVDFTLFKGLSGSLEYYYKYTNDIIQQISLPPSLGYLTFPYVNLAEVSNQGVEVSLNYDGTIGDLKYSIGGNLTTVKNRVEKTYNHLRYSTNAGLVEEGRSIGYERGYKFGGIYQTQEEADAQEAAVKDISRTQNVVAGDAWFQDINGAPSGIYKYETPGADGTLNDKDQSFLWDNIPNYYYGINLGVSWKGVDFSALFNGVGGIYGHWDGLMGMGSASGGTLASAQDAWTVDNHSGNLPRNVYADPNANLSRVSDRDKQSRAYLRLQNIQVGYTLPKSVYNVLGNAISNLRVYVGANNILTITKWKGLNPDSGDNITNPYVTPVVINFGINARF